MFSVVEEKSKLFSNTKNQTVKPSTLEFIEAQRVGEDLARNHLEYIERELKNFKNELELKEKKRG